MPLIRCSSDPFCYHKNMKSFVRLFDDTLTRRIKSWPHWLRQPMLAITNSGQPLTVVLFTALLLVWVYVHRHESLVVSCIIVLLTIAMTTFLKILLRRSRPNTDYVARMWFKTYSFPSGHSAAATVGFGFLAYLLYHTVAMPLGAILAAILIIYAGLVGLSRIYLGAHYPSDVLGGIMLGAAGLLVITVLVRPFV